MVNQPWRRCAQVLAFSALCSHAIASRTEDGGRDYFNEPTEDPNTFYPDLHPCPRSCDDKSPKEWDVFTSYDRLKLCAQPMLFDMSLYNDIDDNDTPTMLRICTTGNAHTRINALFSDKEPPTLQEMPINPPKMFSRRVPERPCLAGSQTNLNLDLTRSGSAEGNLDYVSTVLGQFSDHFDDKSNCHNQILFGFSNGTVAGLYVGASFGKATVKSLVSSLLKSAMTDGHSSTMVGQVCGSGRNARHVLGLAVSTTGNLGAVQKMV
ncbi:hypothetical protein MGU_08730 [Metarhizium guizhouense ARSEF 977]|uniref:Uncharacterized protein n=1 Tax=Metarhizium guizhouense (strain ARSEF 977) TaxID=1276136 RepID=A0A0B4GWN1_METGA|nr:hypothetical protein MGU_08730 [Metarhizium guizhouense ARSEF 977]